MDDEQLAAILDPVYFASQQEEEGRQTRVSIAFHDRDVYIKPYAIQFDQPIRLTTASLVKISQAANPLGTHVAVTVDASGIPWINGFVRDEPLANEQGWTSGHWVSTRAGSMLVVVRIVGLCSIEVEAAFSYVFRYSKGSAERVGIIRIDDTHVRITQDGFHELTKHHTEYWSALMLIAARMQRLQHGGSVFLVPAASDLVEAAFDEEKYRCRANPASFLKELRSKSADHAGIISTDEACDFIARLSGVDGAVLVTSELNVLSFGVFVKSPNPDTGTRRLEGRGARHKSAFWFCEAHTVALAIVVLQDGDISLLIKDRGRDVKWYNVSL